MFFLGKKPHDTEFAKQTLYTGSRTNRYTLVYRMLMRSITCLCVRDAGLYFCLTKVPDFDRRWRASSYKVGHVFAYATFYFLVSWSLPAIFYKQGYLPACINLVMLRILYTKVSRTTQVITQVITKFMQDRRWRASSDASIKA